MMETRSVIQNLVNCTAERNAGDYIKNGILYCGKCGTPKERFVDFSALEIGKRKVRVLCRCQAEAVKERDEERRKMERKQRADERRKIGFTDPLLKEMRFETAERSTYTDIGLRYVRNFKTFKEDGKGLLLHGSVGTGKTFIACCIANELIDEGFTALVTNLTTIANMMSANGSNKQEVLRDLRSFDLLVLDDFGVERHTEYMSETVYSIIDARYRSGLPMIVTTNMDLEQLKNPTSTADARLYDRLLIMCHPVEVKGTNKRRAKIRAEYDDMNHMLGI